MRSPTTTSSSSSERRATSPSASSFPASTTSRRPDCCRSATASSARHRRASRSRRRSSASTPRTRSASSASSSRRATRGRRSRPRSTSALPIPTTLRRSSMPSTKAKKAIGGRPRLLHHLAIPPVAFGSVVGMLGATGLNENAHVIIEKPFGTDLASARALNATVHEMFDESCIFRIDHFLGKEAVDNILAFRFANGLFEPIWNRNHVSYVQIDVPETLVDRGTRRLLRQDRRVPRHDRHAPPAGARVRRDGATDVARARSRCATRR